MTQYKTQYGTIFAVKEHNGAPAIMCRAELSETWSLSSMITPFTPGAWTAEELQEELDNWAPTKGWQPVEAPASAEPPLPMPGDVYQAPQSGQLYKIGELTNGKKTCYLTMRSNAQGGTWVPANSSVYPNLSDAQGEFEAWIRTEQLEPVAPTGAAAATTDGPAAPQPSQAAGTTTTSESGAGANKSSDPPSPAELSSVVSENSPDIAHASTASTASLAKSTPAAPAFDYAGLDDQTVQDLHLAEREFAAGRRLAEIGLRRMADGVAMAHDALCCTDATNCRNGDGRFTPPEHSFGAWCDSVGLNRKAAERLLQVAKLFDNSTPREEKVLEDLGPSLLYAAAKPSAPAELVQAVKNGDITSHKQYQEALAEIRARDEKITELLEMSEAADRRADKAEQAVKDTVRERDDALQLSTVAQRRATEAEKQRDAALQRATAAENRAAGAHKLAEQRGSENAELKAKIRDMENQPRDVAVVQPGEEQIEAWRKEGEDRAAAALQDSVRKANQAKADAQRQVAALQDQLAAARPDADACQRTADTLYETTENLRLLLRTQLRQARLTPKDYGNVVAHVLQTADALRDTVRSCAPAGYDFDNEEDDDFE